MSFSKRGQWNEYEVSYTFKKEKTVVNSYYAQSKEDAISNGKEDIYEIGVKVPEGAEWSANK